MQTQPEKDREDRRTAQTPRPGKREAREWTTAGAGAVQEKDMKRITNSIEVL
jgi:hypothetical protein